MKNYLFLTCFSLIVSIAYSQTIIELPVKESNPELATYIKNYYLNKPFEGVKILETNNGVYLVSLGVVAYADYKNQSSRDRVSVIKARRNALIYLQGSIVTSEQILKTSETVTGKGASYYEQFIDKITETSAGFVDGMSTLITFTSKNNKEYIHVIYTKLIK